MPAGAQGGDDGVVSHFDARPRRLDRAAIAAACSRSIEGPANIDGASLHAGQQRDDARMIADGAGFNDTAVVDDTRKCRILGAGRHDDLATVGLDQLLILRETVQGALINLEMHQLITVKGQGCSITAAEGDCSELRSDDSPG